MRAPSAPTASASRRRLTQSPRRSAEHPGATIPAPIADPTTPGRAPPTRDELLSDAGLQAVLREHGVPSADARLATSAARVAVAGALHRATGAPIASAAYLRMDSAADGAAWYARHCGALQPAMPAGHALRVTAGVSGRAEDDVELDVLRSGGVLKGAVLGEDELPGNLALDPKTFVARPRKTVSTASTKYRPPKSRMAAMRLEGRRVRSQEAA